MTNLLSPKAAVDPTHGRRAVDVFAKEAAARARAISTSRPFVAFVIISALVMGIYYFLVAAPLYVSTTSLQVRGREAPAAAAGGLLDAIGATGGGSTSTDMAALNQYVMSYDMANKLDQRFHLRNVYSQFRPDLLHWLRPGASREAYLGFHRKMIRVRVDRDSQTLTVEVRSFDPVMAQKIAQAIMEISADYINGLSTQVRRDTLRSSEQELKKAQEAAKQARLAMTAYRASTGLIDPTASAAATSAGMASMQQEILQSRAEMAQLLSFNTPSNPQIRQLKARIAGLEEQIAAEQGRVSNTGARDSIAQRLREFEGLMINSEYADKQLVAALTAYDGAKSLASQRERFIVPVIAPNLPQTASQPKRLMSFFEAMFVLVAVYGIVALAIAGIRDHQGI
jgi:capsular polysaccharide transport system permease protein